MRLGLGSPLQTGMPSYGGSKSARSTRDEPLTGRQTKYDDEPQRKGFGNATLVGMAGASGNSGTERSFLPEHTLPRLSDGRITSAGGSIDGLIEALLDGVQKGPMDVSERSAAALRSLALSSPDNATRISRHGITPLIGLISSGSTLAQVHACAVIGLVTIKREELQLDVASKGGLEALTAVLRAGGNSAQEQAAAAIASVSKAEANIPAIIKSGAIAPLVGLLRTAGPAQVRAALTR